MTSWTIPTPLSTALDRLACFLDARVRPLFPLIFLGLLFTTERRRAASSWFRAAGIGTEFRRAYTVIGATGRQAPLLATQVLLDVVAVPDERPDRLVFGLDDTPTPRYGPEVEGAGLHHNPTPGPAGQPFVYGHVWVTVARLTRHARFGTIALPVRAEVYIRRKDVPRLPPERSRPFRTKLEQAAELIGWLAIWLKSKGKTLWLVADGGYAKRPVLRAAKAHGVVVVSRLRKDAALRSLPVEPPPGRRGRKPTYGRDVISLAKRAGHLRGWQTETMVLYGKVVTKTYKTFLATWRPAGGVIRVVLVKEDDGWVAFFCTDPSATAADILGLVADRGALEQTFKDVKEVWGAGQQQLRNLDANVGAWHLNLWAYTLVELEAWDRPEEQLVDRRDSPWDAEPRRPSHADRRKSLRRQCLREEYRAALSGRGQKQKLKRLARRLLKLVA
jgi:DDE superfamily endonuclease